MKILTPQATNQPSTAQHSHVRVVDEDPRCENCPEPAAWRIWYEAPEVATLNGVTVAHNSGLFCSFCGLVRLATAADIEALAAPPVRTFIPTGVKAWTVINEVGRHLAYDPPELVGTKRTRALVFGRHIAIFMVRELVGLPFSEVGRLFSMNHDSALRAHGVIRDALRKSGPARRAVARIAQAVQARGMGA